MARPRGRMICRRGQGANPAKSDTWRTPWEDGEDREDKSRLHVCARAKGVWGGIGALGNDQRQNLKDPAFIIPILPILPRRGKNKGNLRGYGVALCGDHPPMIWGYPPYPPTPKQCATKSCGALGLNHNILKRGIA